ncbi:MAG: hypothetical protein HA495_00560 [Thaumarchaeota archaeon]|nr:hypothetical protein [Nitrososphaerota archaeon]
MSKEKLRLTKIYVYVPTKEKIRKLKRHPRETDDSVVQRLIEFYETRGGTS